MGKGGIAGVGQGFLCRGLFSRRWGRGEEQGWIQDFCVGGLFCRRWGRVGGCSRGGSRISVLGGVSFVEGVGGGCSSGGFRISV